LLWIIEESDRLSSIARLNWLAAAGFSRRIELNDVLMMLGLA
jgi:hypothetical protein